MVAHNYSACTTGKSARSTLVAVSCATAALALVGCAATATTSSFTLPNPAPAVSQRLAEYAPGDPVLVALEFPAAMTPDAQQVWVNRLVAGFGEDEEFGSKLLEQFYVNEALNDSIYHSLELYSAVKARLPKASVILVPQRVTLSGDRLVLEPLLPPGAPPALVRVSLSAMDNPNRDKMMETPYLTFGDAFTPALKVSYSDWFSSDDGGYLIETTFRGICRNHLENVALLDCLNGTDTGAVSDPARRKQLQKARIPAKKVKLDITVKKKEKIDGEEDDGLFEADQATIPGSFARAFEPLVGGTAGLASQAFLTYKDQADNKYLSLYIAELTGSSVPPDLSVGGNLALARKLYAVESAALAQASDAILSKIYYGEFGDAFRLVLGKEAGLIGTRRHIADKQNLSTVMALVGGMAAGAAAGSNDAGLLMRSQYLISAFDSEFTANEQKTIDLVNSFSSRFIGVYMDQVDARELIIDDSKNQISGKLADVRDQLRQIWAKYSVRTEAPD